MIMLLKNISYYWINIRLLLAIVRKASKYYGHIYEKELAGLEVDLVKYELDLHILQQDEKSQVEEKAEANANLKGIVSAVAKKRAMLKLLTNVKKNYYRSISSQSEIVKASSSILLSRWPFWSFLWHRQKIRSEYVNNIIPYKVSSFKELPSKAFTFEVVKKLAIYTYIRDLRENVNVSDSSMSSDEIKQVNIQAKADLLSDIGFKIESSEEGLKAVEDGFSDDDLLLESAREEYKKKHKHYLLKSINRGYIRELYQAEKLLRRMKVVTEKEACIKASKELINNKKLYWHSKIIGFIKIIWSEATKPLRPSQDVLIQHLKVVGVLSDDEYAKKSFNLADSISEVTHKIKASRKKLSAEALGDLLWFASNKVKMVAKSDKIGGLEFSELECGEEVLRDMAIMNGSKRAVMKSKGIEYFNSSRLYENFLSASKEIKFNDSEEYWKVQADLRIRMAESLFRLGNEVHARLCIIAAAYIIEENCPNASDQLKRNALYWMQETDPKHSKRELSNSDIVWDIDKKNLQEELNTIVRKGFDVLERNWEGFNDGLNSVNRFTSDSDEIAEDAMLTTNVPGGLTVAGGLTIGSGLARNNGLAETNVFAWSFVGFVSIPWRLFQSEASESLYDIIGKGLDCYNKGDFRGFLRALSKECVINGKNYSLLKVSENEEGKIKYWHIEGHLIETLLGHDFSPVYIANILYLLAKVFLYSDKLKFIDWVYYIDFLVLKYILRPIIENNKLTEKAESLGNSYLAGLKDIQKLALEEIIMAELSTQKINRFITAKESIVKLQEMKGEDDGKNHISLINAFLHLFGAADENTNVVFDDQAVSLSNSDKVGKLPNGDSITFDMSDSPFEISENEILAEDISHQEALCLDIEKALLSQVFSFDSEELNENWQKLKKERVESDKYLKVFTDEYDIDHKFTLKCDAEKYIYSAKGSLDYANRQIKVFCKKPEVQAEYLRKLSSGVLSIDIGAVYLISSVRKKELYIWNYIATLKELFLGYYGDMKINISEGIHVLRDEYGRFMNLKVLSVKKACVNNPIRSDKILGIERPIPSTCGLGCMERIFQSSETPVYSGSLARDMGGSAEESQPLNQADTYEHDIATLTGGS